MKTGFVIVALTIGMLAGGMAGASLAGDAGNAEAANLYKAAGALPPFLPFPGTPLSPTSSRIPGHTVVFPPGKMR